MMWITRMRLAAAACCALLTCTSLTACGAGDGGKLQAGTGAFDQAQVRLLARLVSGDGPEPAKVRSETKVKIALTGLILMMPPAENTAGPTQLFMPNINRHGAYVAFRKDDGSGCTDYNDDFDVCFVSLDRSQLAPLGMADQGPEPHGIPIGVVNLSHGSGHKADTAGINGRIRARATLTSGRATGSCALAAWSFDPLGRSVEFPSVLTWEMQTAGDSLVLLRQPLNGASPAEQKFVVRANGGTIDLLILHLTNDEYDIVKSATTGTAPELPPLLYESEAQKELEHHFRATYDMINAPATPRPLPRAPLTTGKACPLPVLGMENAQFDSDLLPARERMRVEGALAPMVHGGVRTFSCVMTTADG